MIVYRIEHPATGHGIFRTDWEDIRHTGFLKNMTDDLIKSYYEAFLKIKSYNRDVKHNTPQGESWDDKEKYALAKAILEGEFIDAYVKKHIDKGILKTIEKDYGSGERALCAAPYLSVMADWIDLHAIQYLQMCGFKLYEITLKVRKVTHYVSDTQVVFFPKYIKKKKELCLSELANTEIEFIDED